MHPTKAFINPYLKMPVLVCLLLVLSSVAKAQDSTKVDKLLSFPDKLFGALDKKAGSIQAKLDKQTEKYLHKMEKQEGRLRRKLARKDSALARQLFSGVDQKYAALKNASGKVSKYSSLYSGHLDSLSTALSFLQKQNLASVSSNPKLQKTLNQYKDLQQRFNASDQIRKALQQREQLLKEQLERLGMVKQLKQFKKQVYYYQAQVREYKQTFEDPSKLEQKLLALAQQLPQFKDFFAQHSMLGSLFALPGSNGTSMASLQGLQTRAMVNQSLVDRFGSGPNVTQMLQQNMQAAQSQLSELKNKVSSLSSGSLGNASSEEELPDFKPNNQKTKSFFKRLELGSNVQSQKARSYFPVTSDIGLSVSYKLNDKSVIGVGASYKLGWGSSWNNIRISQEGVGLRSFIDYKLKGSFFLSGGYEQNYRTAFTSMSQLQQYSAWQSSGLIGLTKKYQLSKKLKGNMQLLWDFLSYRQVPRTQAVLFRIGYNFK